MREPVSTFQTLLIIRGQPIESRKHADHMLDAGGIDLSDLLLNVASQLQGFRRLRIDCDERGNLTHQTSTIPQPEILRGEFTEIELTSDRLSGEGLYRGRGPYKRSNRAELEGLEAIHDPRFPLLVDHENNILETSRHNVFIVEGESLITPPLDGRFLPGVTREVILELADQFKINTKLEKISLERAKKSGAMLLSNSLMGISWVSKCDEKSWNEIPELAHKIHRALRLRWESELQQD